METVWNVYYKRMANVWVGHLGYLKIFWEILMSDLHRFLKAQENGKFETAFRELGNGRKQTH